MTDQRCLRERTPKRTAIELLMIDSEIMIVNSKLLYFEIINAYITPVSDRGRQRSILLLTTFHTSFSS
jgi:hypothetical protein